MNTKKKVAVTGVYGYSGRQIALALLERDCEVVALTNSKPPAGEPEPFEGRVRTFPLNFADERALAYALTDCDALINTYWVRFNHRKKNFVQRTAVENTAVLFRAAREAGVGRIVHVSIANPSLDSPFEYYRSKAVMERTLQESGIPHMILRPTVLFGQGLGTGFSQGPTDILMNNIAWTIRRFPIVGVFGDGQYRIRPLHVLDFAKLAVESVYDTSSRIVDAVGPEDYTYRELLKLVGQALGRRRLLIRVPFFVGYAVAQGIGFYHRDVFLTKPEIGALTANLLTSSAPSVGEIHLSQWLREHAQTIGRTYASELSRRGVS